jgi:hypothetical protein
MKRSNPVWLGGVVLGDCDGLKRMIVIVKALHN